MRGLEWRQQYEKYHSKGYNAVAINAEIDTLRADPAVLNNRGIHEYLLSGKAEPKLLSVRLFDDRTKVAAYEQQTQKAKTDGVSNCPLWSKGGESTLANCAMLCVTHNRAKGNR